MGSEHFEPVPEGQRVETDRVEELAAEVRDLREEFAAEREVRRADVDRLDDRIDGLAARLEELEASVRRELEAIRPEVERNSRCRRSYQGADGSGRTNDGPQ